MRLIDADAVIDKLKTLSGCDTCGLKNVGRCDQEYCQGKLFMNLLDSQPTAYDVDNVVDKLSEEINENIDVDTEVPCDNWVVEMQNEMVKRHIEIVRKGGV